MVEDVNCFMHVFVCVMWVWGMCWQRLSSLGCQGSVVVEDRGRDEEVDEDEKQKKKRKKGKNCRNDGNSGYRNETLK